MIAIVSGVHISIIISFRTRIACFKSFRIKLIAQFPMKRHGDEVCSDFDGKSGFVFLVVFSFDGDSGSIESPYLNLSFRTRAACSKSFGIKLLAQFPFKRHGFEVATPPPSGMYFNNRLHIIHALGFRRPHFCIKVFGFQIKRVVIILDNWSIIFSEITN